MKIANQQASFEEVLLAGILDRLTTLTWFQTKDGQKGINRPPSISELLTSKPKEKNKEIHSFTSGEEFESYRQRVIGGE